MGENTYIIWCEETSECAIIDAGMYDSKEQKIVQDFIELNGLIPTKLLGTHAHIDHIFGNWWVKQKYNIPYYLHPSDIVMIERSQSMATLWNLAYTPSMLPDFDLTHGDIIQIGNQLLEVRFVPGHAPGHVIFINQKEHRAIVGDTIFKESIGRTDLPGGNHDLLIEKIQEQILSLPENFELFSGHGPSTNVGHEKKYNPFLKEK